MATTLSRSVVGICVGVDKPGLLHDLKAAGAGAKKFHEWLLSQADLGVDVKSTLFTEASGPVTRRKILEAVSDVVKDRSCDVLFIYLAGHGVAHSAYEEKLLLSEVGKDDSEAINLQVAKQRGMRCGIPHVVIIYDACRSFATTERLRQISGGPIFPTGSSTKTGGHVDVFYACAPDESAFEVADDSGANPKNYKAFFTDVLVDALRKPSGDLIERAQIARRTIPVIPSARLERVLEQQVPIIAAEATPPFDQSPDIDVLSHMPGEFFAIAPSVPGPTPEDSYESVRSTGAGAGELARERSPLRPGISTRTKRARQLKKGGNARPPAAKVLGPADVVKWHAEQSFRDPSARRTTVPKPLQAISRMTGFDRIAAEVLEAKGREGFETRCGFTVIGAKVRRFEVSNNLHHEFVSWESTQNEQHYRVGSQPWDARGGTALIQFASGAGVALAILPGYVGTVLVKEGQVRVVTYTLSRGSLEFARHASRRAELDQRRAIATAAVSIGKLKDVSQRIGEEFAEYIRVDKAMDPCLGVLAAYAYYLADNPRQVQSIWRWMSRSVLTPDSGQPRAETPVPFDVAMLAGALDPASVARPPGIAPFCPWLSLGWSLLDLFDLELHPAIVEASRHRQPGTWTSFTERGIDVLREAMTRKEIL